MEMDRKTGNRVNTEMNDKVLLSLSNNNAPDARTHARVPSQPFDPLFSGIFNHEFHVRRINASVKKTTTETMEGGSSHYGGGCMRTKAKRVYPGTGKAWTRSTHKNRQCVVDGANLFLMQFSLIKI